MFNVLVTFFLVGLWHGANWTFMVWGLMHGAYLAAETVVRRVRARAGVGIAAAGAGAGAAAAGGAIGARRVLRAVLSAALVFAVVTIAWIFFRAPSLSAAVDFFARGVEAPFRSGDHLRYLPTLVLSAALLVYEGLTRRWEHGLAIGRLPAPARWVAYLVLCMAIVVFGYLGGRQGIYVQF